MRWLLPRTESKIATLLPVSSPRFAPCPGRYRHAYLEKIPICCHCGYEKRKPFVPKYLRIDFDEAKKMRDSYKTIKEIADHFEVTSRYMSEELKKRGIK